MFIRTGSSWRSRKAACEARWYTPAALPRLADKLGQEGMELRSCNEDGVIPARPWDQATRATHSSVEDARAANHTISLCVALAHAACPLALLTGDLAAAEHYGTMLLDHSTRHALAHWRA